MNDGPSPAWRDLLAILVVAPAPSIGVIIGMRGGDAAPLAFALGKLWMFVLPTVWYLAIDRRRRSFSPAHHGGFVLGAVLGVAISVVIVLAYVLIGRRLIEIDTVRAFANQTGLDRPGLYIGLVLFWVAANSVLEEYVYRWFLVAKCSRFLPPAGAIVASALLFTVHHIIAMRAQFDWTITILGNVGIFIGGVLWSWMYVRYRSIWPGYLSHAIVDVAVFGVGAWMIFGPGH